MWSNTQFTVLLCLCLVLLCKPVAAFGAGNIASISRIEGHNWRHGDIEDMLKTIACLKGYKWTSMMVKRVYFGNWLRDYSQAVDVGTLKGVQADAIRILVWILAFMSFGYATEEFEVTADRLGVYRPEEHIDHPAGYADGADARQYDSRLRPPVEPREIEVDTETGMNNYIANERGGWATSSGYVRYSFARSIHFGRVFTSGASGRGKEADLCEALRCLGQGLHCLEDFGAHTNYVELSLRELGYRNVFSHTGTATEIFLPNGKQSFPLVTGTFGGVDFLHSVLGEATDHVTQSEVSEVDEMNKALQDASLQNRSGSGSAISQLTGLMSKVPGTRGLCDEAVDLQRASDAQAFELEASGGVQGPAFPPPPGQQASTFAGPPGQDTSSKVPASLQNIDLQKTVARIYPILAFRDKVVRTIASIVSHIPGLEALIDKISETVTLFIMSLLAPYIVPIITAATKQLKTGSTAVVKTSADHQYEPWTNPACTAPTHSLLSKDHFSNVLNEPAGQVASAILQYAAPRVVYAWENPGVPVEQVLDDIVRVFHHPGLRDTRIEIQNTMFNVVERWAGSRPLGGEDLNSVLSSESVKRGGNHRGGNNPHQQAGGGGSAANLTSSSIFGMGSHSKPTGSLFDMFSSGRARELGAERGLDTGNFDYGSMAGDTSAGRAPEWAEAQSRNWDPAGSGYPQQQNQTQLSVSGGGDPYHGRTPEPYTGHQMQQPYGGQQYDPYSQQQQGGYQGYNQGYDRGGYRY
ncbi:MAG: hypothetical protein M1828_004636 [Chrysothrix sp. TS-e1954]|nr:MAG: hypothetical protein M1828_004636 [Chrysothrix sp. TS-e1954]